MCDVHLQIEHSRSVQHNCTSFISRETAKHGLLAEIKRSGHLDGPAIVIVQLGCAADIVHRIGECQNQNAIEACD